MEPNNPPYFLFIFFFLVFMIVLGYVKVRLAPQGQERGLVSPSRVRAPCRGKNLKKNKSHKDQCECFFMFSENNVCFLTKDQQSPNRSKNEYFCNNFTFNLRTFNWPQVSFIFRRIGSDDFLVGSRIRRILYAAYPVSGVNQISGRLTGYCGRKKSFVTIFFYNTITVVRMSVCLRVTLTLQGLNKPIS